MRTQPIASKREREKQTVSLMISLYCRKKHVTGGKVLCRDCEELRQYAMQRSDKCPFMETKTFCSNCRVHCYRPAMREKNPCGYAFLRPENAVLSSGHGGASCHRIPQGTEKTEKGQLKKATSAGSHSGGRRI